MPAGSLPEPGEWGQTLEPPSRWGGVYKLHRTFHYGSVDGFVRITTPAPVPHVHCRVTPQLSSVSSQQFSGQHSLHSLTFCTPRGFHAFPVAHKGGMDGTQGVSA
jgi:hypothetical protein